MAKVKKVPTKEQSQKGRMRRNKGSSFERYVAVLIEKFLEVDHLIIRRTPNSGGFGGTISNDIIIPPEYKEILPVAVECKNQEKWTLESFFSGNSFTYVRWAIQVIDESKDDEIPVVFFTRNNIPPLVYLPTIINIPFMIPSTLHIMMMPAGGVVITPEDFFEHIDWVKTVHRQQFCTLNDLLLHYQEVMVLRSKSRKVRKRK